MRTCLHVHVGARATRHVHPRQSRCTSPDFSSLLSWPRHKCRRDKRIQWLGAPCTGGDVLIWLPCTMPGTGSGRNVPKIRLTRTTGGFPSLFASGGGHGPLPGLTRRRSPCIQKRARSYPNNAVGPIKDFTSNPRLSRARVPGYVRPAAGFCSVLDLVLPTWGTL